MKCPYKEKTTVTTYTSSMFETYITRLQVLGTMRQGTSKDSEDGCNIGDGAPFRLVRLDGGGCLRDSVVR